MAAHKKTHVAPCQAWPAFLHLCFFKHLVSFLFPHVFIHSLSFLSCFCFCGWFSLFCSHSAVSPSHYTSCCAYVVFYSTCAFQLLHLCSSSAALASTAAPAPAAASAALHQLLCFCSTCAPQLLLSAFDSHIIIFYDISIIISSSSITTLSYHIITYLPAIFHHMIFHFIISSLDISIIISSLIFIFSTFFLCIIIFISIIIIFHLSSSSST